MPLYSYECKKCGYQFDQFAAMKDRNKKRKCPNCGSTKIEKKLNGSYGIVMR